MKTLCSSCSTRNWDDLPPEIIHRIHSLLYQGRRDSATVIRTGLVSKAWQRAWSISPTLIFKGSFTSTKVVVIDIFANKVDDTLSRYDQQKLHIKSLLFCFYTFICPHRLDSWLDKARRCGVQDIRLKGYPSSNKPVVLSTLFAIQTIQKLTLYEFKISFIDDKSLSSVRCCSLKNLRLTKVDISEQTMKHILACCPLVETLAVRHCSGFLKIHLTNLRSLRLFRFYVSISVHQTINMTDSQAKFLTHLSLDNVQITDADFATFSSKFQFLRYLSLKGCPLLERINIKFDLLTRLKLRPERIRAANIDAPNLRILDYEGFLENLTFTNVTPGQLEFGNLRVMEGKKDTSWFLNLREVLRKFRQCKVEILYFGEEMSYHDVEHLRVIASPALEENVTQLLFHMLLSPVLGTDHGTTTVDALFSICRPKYLFLQKAIKDDHDIFEFVLKKLATAAGITNQNCCMGQATKCWLHYLKDAKIRLLDKLNFKEHREDQNDEAGWRSIGVAWKSIVGALSTPYKTAVIKLEWIGHSHSSSL